MQFSSLINIVIKSYPRRLVSDFSMEDKLYMEILNYLNSTSTDNEKYPEHICAITSTQNRMGAKANFRRKARHYHNTNDGILMYRRQEVLPKSRLPTILNAYHDNPTS